MLLFCDRERGRRRGGIDEYRPIEVRPCNVQPREKTKGTYLLTVIHACFFMNALVT